MQRTKNTLLRFWYGLCTPESVLALFLAVQIIGVRFPGCLLVLCGVALVLLLRKPYRTQLSDCFFCDWFLGRGFLFQRRPKRSSRPKSCKAAAGELIGQAKALPAALSARPGEYWTYTHDTVIHRLERMENVSDLRAIPVYLGTLRTAAAALAGRNCRKCRGKEQCPFVNREEVRQFYRVTFRVNDKKTEVLERNE